MTREVKFPPELVMGFIEDYKRANDGNSPSIQAIMDGLGIRSKSHVSRLLDMLEAHGVQALSDCRRGECGLCAIDIVSVQGMVDHRDVFFSPQQKQANHKLCACVSRVCGGGVVLDSAFRPD